MNSRSFDFVTIFKRGKSKDDLPITVYQNNGNDIRYQNSLEAYIETSNLESSKEQQKQNINELKKMYELQRKRESTNEERKNLLDLYDYFMNKQEQCRGE